MTAEEIRIRLGLKPFDEFEYDVLCSLKDRKGLTRKEAINERFRQTGRTTKVFCQALSAISNGNKVVFLSDSGSTTKRAREKLKDYAKLLELNISLILDLGLSYNSSGMDGLRGVGNIVVFHDHQMP